MPSAALIEHSEGQSFAMFTLQRLTTFIWLSPASFKARSELVSLWKWAGNGRPALLAGFPIFPYTAYHYTGSIVNTMHLPQVCCRWKVDTDSQLNKMNWIPSSSRLFNRVQLSGASYFQASGDAAVLNSDNLFKIHLNTTLETQTWNKTVLCSTQLQERESLTQITEENSAGHRSAQHKMLPWIQPHFLMEAQDSPLTHTDPDSIEPPALFQQERETRIKISQLSFKNQGPF